MKKIYILLVLFIGIQFTSNCFSQTGPELYLEDFTSIKNNMKHFVDTISKDSIFDFKIKVRNSGDEPLIIAQIKGTDPCFAYSIPKNPINPGETDIITIKCPIRPDYRVITSFGIYSNGKNNSDAYFVVTRWYK